jgi:MFS family permease
MFTKADIEKYFNAEKQESLLFVGIGLAAIIAAIVIFFFLKTPFYKGAAIPLVLVGLLLGVVGFNVYKRSDEDRKRNVYAYDLNPQELKEKELPRMQVVMKNFIIYRYTEIALAIIGIGMFFYFRNDETRYFWKGFGLGLTIMALLALFADYFAEKRGHVYIKGVEGFVNRTTK